MSQIQTTQGKQQNLRSGTRLAFETLESRNMLTTLSLLGSPEAVTPNQLVQFDIPIFVGDNPDTIATTAINDKTYRFTSSHSADESGSFSAAFQGALDFRIENTSASQSPVLISWQIDLETGPSSFFPFVDTKAKTNGTFISGGVETPIFFEGIDDEIDTQSIQNSIVLPTNGDTFSIDLWGYTAVDAGSASYDITVDVTILPDLTISSLDWSQVDGVMGTYQVNGDPEGASNVDIGFYWSADAEYDALDIQALPSQSVPLTPNSELPFDAMWGATGEPPRETDNFLLAYIDPTGDGQVEEVLEDNNWQAIDLRRKIDVSVAVEFENNGELVSNLDYKDVFDASYYVQNNSPFRLKVDLAAIGGNSIGEDRWGGRVPSLDSSFTATLGPAQSNTSRQFVAKSEDAFANWAWIPFVNPLRDDGFSFGEFATNVYKDALTGLAQVFPVARAVSSVTGAFETLDQALTEFNAPALLYLQQLPTADIWTETSVTPQAGNVAPIVERHNISSIVPDDKREAFTEFVTAWQLLEAVKLTLSAQSLPTNTLSYLIERASLAIGQIDNKYREAADPPDMNFRTFTELNLYGQLPPEAIGDTPEHYRARLQYWQKESNAAYFRAIDKRDGANLEGAAAWAAEQLIAASNYSHMNGILSAESAALSAVLKPQLDAFIGTPQDAALELQTNGLSEEVRGILTAAGFSEASIDANDTAVRGLTASDLSDYNSDTILATEYQSALQRFHNGNQSLRIAIDIRRDELGYNTQQLEPAELSELQVLTDELVAVSGESNLSYQIYAAAQKLASKARSFAITNNNYEAVESYLDQAYLALIQPPALAMSFDTWSSRVSELESAGSLSTVAANNLTGRGDAINAAIATSQWTAAENAIAQTMTELSNYSEADISPEAQTELAHKLQYLDQLLFQDRTLPQLTVDGLTSDLRIGLNRTSGLSSLGGLTNNLGGTLVGGMLNIIVPANDDYTVELSSTGEVIADEMGVLRIDGVPFADIQPQSTDKEIIVELRANATEESLRELIASLTVQSTNPQDTGSSNIQVSLQDGFGGEYQQMITITSIPSPAGDYDLDTDIDSNDYQLWRDSYGATAGAGLRADGNQDGVVNAADYTVWRDSLSQTPEPLAGDYNRDDVVSGEDYDFWRANYGAVSGIGLQADGNGDGRVDAADYTVWRDRLPPVVEQPSQIQEVEVRETTSEQQAMPTMLSLKVEERATSSKTPLEPNRIQPENGQDELLLHQKVYADLGSQEERATDSLSSRLGEDEDETLDTTEADQHLDQAFAELTIDRDL